MVHTWLALAGALIVAATVLMVQSFRRRDSIRGLVAMVLTLLATIPAAVYGLIGA